MIIQKLIISFCIISIAIICFASYILNFNATILYISTYLLFIVAYVLVYNLTVTIEIERYKKRIDESYRCNHKRLFRINCSSK